MNGTHGGKLLLVLITTTTLIVMAAVCASAWLTIDRSNQLREDQIAGCERANVQREYVNRIIDELRLDLDPIPIPNCREIIANPPTTGGTQ